LTKSPSLKNSAATLEPVTAALLAFLLLGETLEPLQILGRGLVLGAVITLGAGMNR